MFPYKYLVVLALAFCANCIPISKRDEGSQCVNVYNECPEWKNAGFCEQHQEYMKSTCPVTCGYCKETASDLDEEEDGGSSESVEASGSSGDESTGLRKSNSGKESENEAKKAENKNEESKKAGGKATEQERTENAEKYEDEETEGESKAKKPVQQKKKNLMESMLENGSLKAVSVAKGKAREKVPNHSNMQNINEDNEDNEDNEEDATNIDLDFKDTGLEHFSGSGGDDGKVHLTLRQNFDSKYEDKTTPAYKILSGNFEKDMDQALGGEDSVSDVNFSEAEVEGNPRTTGKVRVNFNFNGDYNKLQNIVKSGSINGLLVVKNSLEGPMLNLEESE